MQPWKLVADPSGYIFTWLIGYSGLLGPIGGILVCDYFIVRRTEMNLAGLYDRNGPYKYAGGYNPAAIIALIFAILPNIPGFLAQIGVIEAGPIWSAFYNYAWFTGFFIAFALYYVLMRVFNAPKENNAV